MLEGLVDEEAAFLGPLGVHPDVAGVCGAGFGLGVALLGMLGVEQPLPRDLELDTEFGKQRVQLAGAHPVVFSDTADSDRASRGEHLVVVGELGAGLGEFLLGAATSQTLIP